MAIDQDQLNVLNRIEKILAASNHTTSSLGGGATKGGTTSRYDSQAARAQEAQLQQTKKITVSTGKAVDRLGYASNRSAENLIDFSRKTGIAGAGLGELTSTVAKSIAQISASRADLGKIDMSTTLTALQAAVSDAASSIKASNLAKGDTTGFAKTIGTLDSIVDTQLNPRLGTLGHALQNVISTLITSRADFVDAMDDDGARAKTFGKNLNTAISALERRGGIGAQMEILRRRLIGLNNAMRSTASLVRRGGKGGGGGGGDGGDDTAALDETGNTPKKDKKTDSGFLSGFFDPVKAAFGLAAGRAAANIFKTINDMFQVTGARGFGTLGKTFWDLSTNAILAGQSLEEYTKMIAANEGTAARFESFNAFDKQLDVGRDSLKKFGIFGMEATNLSAAMANSAQSLGVPVSDITKSMHGQVSVFEQLRKTTGITAEQFEEMNRTLQQSEVVQRELIGLDPAERAGRLTQLQQTATMGKKFGLTAQAASQLTDALLSQRKSTVKERFNQRGRLQQSLALVGMDPATIAEAAALAGKRMKTPEEEQRMLEILGEYGQRSEDIKQNGGPGMANAVETGDQNLEAVGLGPMLKAGIDLRAAQQSGKNTVNNDMGQQLGVIGKGVGTLISLLEGLGKSTLVQIGMGIVGAIALAQVAQVASAAATGTATVTAIGSSTMAIVAAIRASLGMAGKPYGGNPDDFVGPQKPEDQTKGKGKGKWAGRFGKIGIAGGLTAVAGVGLGAYNYAHAEEDAKADDGDVSKKKGEAIGEGIGTVAGTIAGAFLGPLGAMIVGTLGGFAGKLIGGFVNSESALEKNTREVKDQNELMIKAKRAKAGPDVISSGNLGSLAANVLQTGIADAGLTAEEKAKSQDIVDKKNGTGKYMAKTISVADVDAMGAMTGTYHDEANPKYREPITQSSVSTQLATIATPVSPTQLKVNEAQLNTAVTAQVDAATASNAISKQVGSTGTNSTIIAPELLKALQDSAAAGNSQTEMIAQLLRSPAFASRLPDNTVMMGQARA